MANKIIIKKSSVAGKVPAAGDLEIGELAVNLADQKLYSKNASGTVVQLGGGSGSGDVVGPSSATDNALVRFDGTTGKLIQNGLITSDDAGNVANINSLGFDTTPTTVPTTEGSLYWDSADGNQTLSLVMANGDAVQQIGMEQYYRVKASSAITNGQVVMFTGTVGASGGLTAAPATGLTAATASYVMGIATQDIALNSWGYITAFGLVRNINTSAFTDGAILYYNPSVTGGLATTIPSAPNAKIQVCAVVHAASNGSLFVRPSFGGILGQYEGDVNIANPLDGQLLIRDQTSGKWVNANLTAGTGIGVTNAAGSITISNSGVTSIAGTTNQVTASASTGGVTLSLPATINVNTSGNAATATSAGKWTTARTLSFTGDATGSGSVDGSANVATALTLANTAVTAGSYTNTALTVDAKGRITAASSGTAPVTSVTASGALASSGGTTPAITHSTADGFLHVPATGTTNNGKVLTAGATAGSLSWTTPTTGTVTSVSGTGTVSGLSLSGTVTTSGNITLGGTLAVTPSNFASQTANTFLAAPNGTAGTPTFRSIVAADIPTLNQNTTGTASNVTGTVAIANGGTGATTASAALTNLGAYPSSNPSGYTSNTGTVTSVGMTVPTGLSVSGTPITTSGTFAVTMTAGYSIPTTASQTNWDSAYTQRLQWDGGSTNLVAATGRTSLGGTTVGQNFFTLTNPSAITFPRVNADNTVSMLDAATFRTAIGAGTGSGTVTSVTGTAPIASTGGATPAISISQATTSTNGYLSSTDWNTFNGKWTNGTAMSATTGSFSGQVTSTVATGTSPFSIASTTMVTNLNVDMLDGQHGSYYQPASTAITTSNIGSQSVNYATSAGSATSATSATTATTANGVAAGVVAGKMIYNSFTATASQTTFTTTNTYTSGKIDVYANGVRMVNGSDVTVTGGTSVVFASGLASGTRVDLVYPI